MFAWFGLITLNIKIVIGWVFVELIIASLGAEKLLG